MNQLANEQLSSHPIPSVPYRTPQFRRAAAAAAGGPRVRRDIPHIPRRLFNFRVPTVSLVLCATSCLAHGNSSSSSVSPSAALAGRQLWRDALGRDITIVRCS